jgi:uncharacterized protein
MEPAHLHRSFCCPDLLCKHHWSQTPSARCKGGEGHGRGTVRFAFAEQRVRPLSGCPVHYLDHVENRAPPQLRLRPRGPAQTPTILSGRSGLGYYCLSLLIITLWKTGLLVIDNRLLSGSDIFRYGTIWLLGFFLVGLLEEYLTRGYLQYTLTRGLSGIYELAFKGRYSKVLGFWTAAAIFSILFGLGHGRNPGESPIGLLSAGLASMVFCFSLWRTGSLWWAIGFHTSWDWGQSFLYGVADSGTMVQHHLLATHPVGKAILSGGATGPEGSIFIVAVLALASLIIFFTLPRARFGDSPRRGI